MTALIFGATPPLPKRCLTCKQPQWQWDSNMPFGSGWVCLNCTIRNPMAIKHGPGPDGTTCGGCIHRIMVGGHARNYPKCDLRNDVTNGAKTDQKASWPACARFEPIQEEAQ